jgi:DnaJ-class molecular chaperone
MATTPLQKCPTCDGIGRVFVIRQEPMYDCGYVRELAKCPECNGTRVAKKPVGRVRAFLARVGVRA